jgi:hypothetical protein
MPSDQQCEKLGENPGANEHGVGLSAVEAPANRVA